LFKDLASIFVRKDRNLPIEMPDLDVVPIHELLSNRNRLFVVIRYDDLRSFEVSVVADDIGPIICQRSSPEGCG
jgi:hypothetical protein